MFDDNAAIIAVGKHEQNQRASRIVWSVSGNLKNNFGGGPKLAQQRDECLFVDGLSLLYLYRTINRKTLDAMSGVRF
jgi:hypothetical protein